MNLFKYFLDEIKLEVERMVGAGALPAGLDLGRIAVEPTRDPAHGDISTNAAMVRSSVTKAPSERTRTAYAGPEGLSAGRTGARWSPKRYSLSPTGSSGASWISRRPNAGS